FDDGVLVAGDAAMMVNNLHREGSNMAMAAGRMAGETAIQAKRAGDWSARSLAQYRELLEASFVLQDLRKYRRLPDLVERRPDLPGEPAQSTGAAIHSARSARSHSWNWWSCSRSSLCSSRWRCRATSSRAGTRTGWKRRISFRSSKRWNGPTTNSGTRLPRT